MRRPKSRKSLDRTQRRLSESQEIKLLDEWINAGRPDRGSNPLALPTPTATAPVGRLANGGFTPYAGCRLFAQLPISQKTKDALPPKYTEMSEIQRASLPHSLSGSDVLGAAKTGSGKTLAFIIPVIEKLYRERWGPEDGVGSIIISPTKELASQLFEELKAVGKHHSLSAGLLIGGRKDVDAEKERVNSLNILVCTPGRLLQHMDETPNFDCSQLQILVLDEADRILDTGFRNEVDAIISQLPTWRQTLLFSATQTKSVKDLARLSLKDPEYISVHAESVTATPERLRQIAMEVPLDQKLNMLWSFIKSHISSKILVFLSTRKQVKFVYEAFKKLRPGTPLKCLHGHMKQDVRLAIYTEFCQKPSVLFTTDVASRGLDVPGVDWVVQVDCPEDVATYIHRVGRTARFTSKGDSVLFLVPSEIPMLTKLQAAEPKIPIKLKKANLQKMQLVSGSLSSLLVKHSNLLPLAERAFKTYIRSIRKQRDKEVFDVHKLPIEEFSASLGLPTTPRIRFIEKVKGKKVPSETSYQQEEQNEDGEVAVHHQKQAMDILKEEVEDDILLPKESILEVEGGQPSILSHQKKKKKIKINLHKPSGTRVKYDEDGNIIPPLAVLADTQSEYGGFQPNKVAERYAKLNALKKERDKEDKLLHRQRLREKRTKEKMKLKASRERDEEAYEEDGISESDEVKNKRLKRSKINFDSDDEAAYENGSVGLSTDSISIAEQEALALKLLSSLHSS